MGTRAFEVQRGQVWQDRDRRCIGCEFKIVGFGYDGDPAWNYFCVRGREMDKAIVFHTVTRRHSQILLRRLRPMGGAYKLLGRFDSA